MRKPEYDWDEAFLAMAVVMSKRSKDDSTQCGSVLVGTDNVVLATGYNGPPKNINDTLVPWNQRPQKYAYIMHSEENALWFASGSHGFDKINNSTMYCTHYPCTECILRMIFCGVARCVVPANHTPYPMSKYQVEPQTLLDSQDFYSEQLEIVLYGQSES